MAKKKINPKKVRKLMIVSLIIIVVIVGAVITVKKLTKKTPIEETVKVIDTVKDYTLDDNETDYYKNLFNELKNTLNKENVDEEKYAKLVSQLFLSDFYNLDNKVNKNDVGGTQFVYKDFQSDFEKMARDTVYHSVENNLYGDRKQELPVVYSVDVLDIKQDSYDYLDKTDESAYYIDLIIKYEKDLGYQENVSLILVHNNDKLEIVKMQ